MPNIKSAKKRVKVIEKKTLRNRKIKSELKTYIKKQEALINAHDKAAASAALPVVVKKLDKAGAKGVMHKNAIARRKSRLARRINAMA